MYQISDHMSSITGRKRSLFSEDLEARSTELAEMTEPGRFLVVGGAGTIGQAVVKQLFIRNPRQLDVVDISENNLVELVRDIRSSIGYGQGDFRTFALDCGSVEFDAFVAAEGPYDFILNLSALKHVRSERDPYTLMRMIAVNVLNSLKLYRIARQRYFAVSTDKSTRPANLMGASKRMMELALAAEAGIHDIPLASARFANVAFSDGSLLHGFRERILKRQPLSAPTDVKRYFISQQESGELCLLSAMLANSREIFFPKLEPDQHLLTFSEIAGRFLRQLGYEPRLCSSEDEARSLAASGPTDGTWPCYFFESDTTGEKPVEEFHAPGDNLDMDRFQAIGVLLDAFPESDAGVRRFLREIDRMRGDGAWSKAELVELFRECVPELDHRETHKYLDQRM